MPLPSAPEPDVGPRQEIIDLAVGVAVDDGYYPGRKHKYGPSSALQILQTDVDYDAAPWASVGRHIEEKTFKDVILPAIAAIREMDDEPFRRTMVNIARATQDWNIPQFLRICKAVWFNNPSNVVAASPDRRVLPPFKSRHSTRQITEASAEYDFADPAYRSIEEGFDGVYEGDYLTGEHT